MRDSPRTISSHPMLLEPHERTTPAILRVGLPVARPVVGEKRMTRVVVHDELRAASRLRTLRDRLLHLLERVLRNALILASI